MACLLTVLVCCHLRVAVLGSHGLVVFIELGARVELDCGSWLVLSGRFACSF